MKLFLIYIFVFLLPNSIVSQNELAPDGGDEYKFEHTHGPCITNEERAVINNKIEFNIQKYKIKRTQNKNMMVLFDWPLAQNPIFDYNSTYAISNFVDHNTSYPNELEDWDCGTHTYDTSSGYNHQGLDLYLWPFDENQVDDDQSWAVAAASGTILAKNDGNIDNSCNFNSNPSNYVILEHSDGSRTWYLHLKLNSLTTKAIGASVNAGEYLGVIASSGNSTGPHLHFECYDSGLNLIDPYAGNCNNLNTPSFWNTQKPYWDPEINTLLIHTSPPSFQACPNPDITNIASSLNYGQYYNFAAYYHDQQSSNTSTYVIKRPDGSTWQTWSHSPTQNYRSSWWYWTWGVPSYEPTGTWTFEATLNGNTVIREVFIGTPCPSSYSSANGNPLIGNQNSNADFETDGLIESTQIISGATSIVDYDSGTTICLDPGFEVMSGAQFSAFIDGCGGSQ
jgi:murein DD-endopeptidase MepM/ murein hydrolase activator NlpD